MALRAVGFLSLLCLRLCLFLARRAASTSTDALLLLCWSCAPAQGCAATAPGRSQGVSSLLASADTLQCPTYVFRVWRLRASVGGVASGARSNAWPGLSIVFWNGAPRRNLYASLPIPWAKNGVWFARWGVDDVCPRARQSLLLAPCPAALTWQAPVA